MESPLGNTEIKDASEVCFKNISLFGFQFLLYLRGLELLGLVTHANYDNF